MIRSIALGAALLFAGNALGEYRGEIMLAPAGFGPGSDMMAPEHDPNRYLSTRFDGYRVRETVDSPGFSVRLAPDEQFRLGLKCDPADERCGGFGATFTLGHFGLTFVNQEEDGMSAGLFWRSSLGF